MPRQLFDDSPVARLGARSRWTVLFSTVAHLIIIALVVIVPLMATGALPDVHARLTGVVPVDVQPPPPPPPPSGSTTARVPTNAAPLVAPSGIIDAPDVPEQPGRSDVGDFPELGGGIAGIPGGTGVAGDPLIIAPPPVPPAPQKPLRPGGQISAPQRIVSTVPDYPAVARAARVEGTVILEAIIDVNGGVHDVRVLRSIPLLDHAAIVAVRQWRYTPTLLNGVPMPVIMTVMVTFKLQ